MPLYQAHLTGGLFIYVVNGYYSQSGAFRAFPILDNEQGCFNAEQERISTGVRL